MTEYSTSHWSLQQDAFGRLILIRPYQPDCIVSPVRAFPLESPDTGIALVDSHGHEQAWIEQMSDLAQETRDLVTRALAVRDFMPVIKAITAISSTSTPCNWTIKTDRGDCTLRLRSEQDIRRLSNERLLITDSDGLCYLIANPKSLDRASRRLLDHFL